MRICFIIKVAIAYLFNFMNINACFICNSTLNWKLIKINGMFCYQKINSTNYFDATDQCNLINGTLPTNYLENYKSEAWINFLGNFSTFKVTGDANNLVKSFPLTTVIRTTSLMENQSCLAIASMKMGNVQHSLVNCGNTLNKLWCFKKMSGATNICQSINWFTTLNNYCYVKINDSMNFQTAANYCINNYNNSFMNNDNNILPQELNYDRNSTNFWLNFKIVREYNNDSGYKYINMNFGDTFVNVSYLKFSVFDSTVQSYVVRYISDNFQSKSNYSITLVPYIQIQNITIISGINCLTNGIFSSKNCSMPEVLPPQLVSTKTDLMSLLGIQLPNIKYPILFIMKIDSLQSDLFDSDIFFSYEGELIPNNTYYATLNVLNYSNIDKPWRLTTENSNNNFSYICKTVLNSDGACNENWLRVRRNGLNCYYISENLVNINDAQDFCSNESSELFYFDSEAEFLFVMSKANAVNSYWTSFTTSTTVKPMENSLTFSTLSQKSKMILNNFEFFIEDVLQSNTECIQMDYNYDKSAFIITNKICTDNMTTYCEQPANEGIIIIIKVIQVLIKLIG